MRKPGLTGEQCGTAKLTEREVRAIRMRHANGESAATLAELFHVTPQNVSLILRRETWRHVE